MRDKTTYTVGVAFAVVTIFAMFVIGFTQPDSPHSIYRTSSSPPPPAEYFDPAHILGVYTLSDSTNVIKKAVVYENTETELLDIYLANQNLAKNSAVRLREVDYDKNTFPFHNPVDINVHSGSSLHGKEKGYIVIIINGTGDTADFEIVDETGKITLNSFNILLMNNPNIAAAGKNCIFGGYTFKEWLGDDVFRIELGCLVEGSEYFITMDAESGNIFGGN